MDSESIHTIEESTLHNLFKLARETQDDTPNVTEIMVIVEMMFPFHEHPFVEEKIEDWLENVEGVDPDLMH